MTTYRGILQSFTSLPTRDDKFDPDRFDVRLLGQTHYPVAERGTTNKIDELAKLEPGSEIELHATPQNYVYFWRLLASPRRLPDNHMPAGTYSASIASLTKRDDGSLAISYVVHVTPGVGPGTIITQVIKEAAPEPTPEPELKHGRLSDDSIFSIRHVGRNRTADGASSDCTTIVQTTLDALCDEAIERGVEKRQVYRELSMHADRIAAERDQLIAQIKVIANDVLRYRQNTYAHECQSDCRCAGARLLKIADRGGKPCHECAGRGCALCRI